MPVKMAMNSSHYLVFSCRSDEINKQFVKEKTLQYVLIKKKDF